MLIWTIWIKYFHFRLSISPPCTFLFQWYEWPFYPNISIIFVCSFLKRWNKGEDEIFFSHVSLFQPTFPTGSSISSEMLCFVDWESADGKAWAIADQKIADCDRRSFFRDRIAIGDRHLVKRSQCNRQSQN